MDSFGLTLSDPAFYLKKIVLFQPFMSCPFVVYLSRAGVENFPLILCKLEDNHIVSPVKIILLIHINR